LRAGRLAPHAIASRAGVRLRLTLLFGGLFLVSGAALLGITYGLVSRATPGIVVQQSDGFSSGGGAATAGPDGGSAEIIGGAEVGPGSDPSQQLQFIAARSASGTGSAENDALLMYSGVALAIMAAASVALGWFAAGRALRPLRRITAAAQRISATSLRERLAIDGPADDLRELADTIDGLFARLDASLDAQRQFVANASHELRTPLARSRTLLEVALRQPDQDRLRPACERAIAATCEQERLIEALLVLARGQRGLARRDLVDLAAVARDVLAARAAEITARGLAVDVTLAPALLAGDLALAERAVANLIDNALRHNVPDGNVRVSVGLAGDGGDAQPVTELVPGDHGSASPPGAVLTVANTGPDVPHGDIARLLQPFQRRVAGRAGSREGLGLGLSITSAIAAAHGAALSVDSRPEGGLVVELAFPPVPDWLASSGSRPQFAAGDRYLTMRG
jgi:signal transduction histidine kinase